MNRKAWKEYETKVRELTKTQPTHLLQDSDKLKCKWKGHFNSDKHYLIDHKIPIWYGFNNSILAEDIASLCNLRWITAKANRIKNTKLFIDDDNRHLLVSQIGVY